MKKNILKVFVCLLTLSLLFTGCAKKEEPTTAEPKENEAVTLTIGATPVPHTEILEFIKPKLEKEGIQLEIKEFTDYVTPNLALAEKEIDANFFQHLPYLETFNKERGLDLVSAVNVHVEPLGLYSKKIKSLDALENGSTITIPNDPTNGGRALILLDTKGIIKLKEDAGLEATEKDIDKNPKNLVFKPIDAAQLPRTLDDVDASVINTNFALEGGLNPKEDALLIEGSESPYANIVTVRPEDKDSEKIQKLIKILQSEDVKKFIEKKYNGAIVPAF
ncbi:MetQ/NlpA family ABC transporter substrate-binding protein [Crassaminicella profunda]|uniref:MetQ/NlpA family ABC transporter substrate-binding protein n=1 Tax=Crassaminicella profunda TaxID=1286698 RepID=UPI001CA729B0|nr:MetQ/NlpA family ABC transporter substrate-binding protein [Crassaminicella profunda]QZY55748.1 MetQ/NlpA family ABC transporter substrate-binding protein [Crassaminicella profunda]